MEDIAKNLKWPQLYSSSIRLDSIQFDSNWCSIVYEMNNAHWTCFEIIYVNSRTNANHIHIFPSDCLSFTNHFYFHCLLSFVASSQMGSTFWTLNFFFNNLIQEVWMAVSLVLEKQKWKFLEWINYARSIFSPLGHCNNNDERKTKNYPFKTRFPNEHAIRIQNFMAEKCKISHLNEKKINWNDSFNFRETGTNWTVYTWLDTLTHKFTSSFDFIWVVKHNDAYTSHQLPNVCFFSSITVTQVFLNAKKKNDRIFLAL